MKIFGPVPSRRLGRSVGINNIIPKHCTYACIYCQAGRTTNCNIKRQPFYRPEEILRETFEKIKAAKRMGEQIDYITFVADGEPTLDINIGFLIEELKKNGNRVAVVTNSSLIWNDDVKKEIEKADLVSVKVDAVKKEIWKKINRPHGKLDLKTILNGIIEFKNLYKGILITETMVVKNINDTEENIKETADFIQEINPEKAYISIPTRPPVEKWVEPPGEELLNRSYQIIREKIENTEYLTGYEGSAFAFTGDVRRDLLSITSVHPMKEKAVKEFLKKADSEWDIIQGLIEAKQIQETIYKGEKFYLRKFS